MPDNRRNFLKTIGIGSATIGIGGLTFSSCSSNFSRTESSPKKILEVSENGAIVETNYGKIRGYRRNSLSL